MSEEAVQTQTQSTNTSHILTDTSTTETNINSVPSDNQERSLSPEPTIPEKGSKNCELCQRSRNVLIRCQIDKTKKWYFICTGKCWTEVSGGKVDGPGFPNYKYGGMWKNKHAGVSAKIRGKAKERNSKGVGETIEGKKGKSSGRRKEGKFDEVNDQEEGQTDFSGRDSDTS